MKWAWKITQIAGIDVYVHSTFLLLVAGFGFSYWKTHGTLGAAVEGMTFIIALFFCVVLHEFGHALMAKRFGVVTKHITLLPIGGVASMEKMPEKPSEEILVAIAGPAVNIVIALLLFSWIYIQQIPIEIHEETIDIPMIYRLLYVNIFLVLFNMLPAFPMDGGRVLRAALAFKMPHHKATQSAATIGKVFAGMFAILSFYGNPMLMLIAIFLWFGATAENQMEQIDVQLANTTAEDIMLREFHTITPLDNMNTAIKYTLGSGQKHFPVMDSSKLYGLLTHEQMLKTIHDYGQDASVEKAALQNFEIVAHDTPVPKLLHHIQEHNIPVIGVGKANRLIGLVTLENIAEYLRINQAGIDA